MPKTAKIGRDDSAEFIHNHNIQTEQLKYAVRKEVEESNLLREAKKSLMRSFNAEQAQREREEEQIRQLKEQLLQAKQTAKELRDAIREERRKQRLLRGDTADRSDSDDEDLMADVSDVDGTDDDFLIDDFDELVSELQMRNTSKSLSQRRATVAVGAAQQAQLLKLAEEEEEAKQRTQRIKTHKLAIKAWNAREYHLTNDKRSMPIKDRTSFNKVAAKTKMDALLQEGLDRERNVLNAINSAIMNYLEPLLKSRMLQASQAHAIFSNLASMAPAQKVLLALLEAVVDGKKQLKHLADFFCSRMELYREFLQTRDERKENLAEVILNNQQVAKWFTDPFSKTSSGALQELLDLPVQHVLHYPMWFVGLLECCPETDGSFDVLARTLGTLNIVIRESGYEQYCRSCDSLPRALITELDMRFRWSSKGREQGSFMNSKLQRGILTQLQCQTWLSATERLKRSPEACLVILFNDVLVITRNHGSEASELLFKSFTSLESLVVWDLPPLVGEKTFRLELVDMTTGEKQVLEMWSEEEKNKFLQAVTAAQLVVDCSVETLLEQLR